MKDFDDETRDTHAGVCRGCKKKRHDLRDRIIDFIQTNQFSCTEFVIDDVFRMFYGENSEMAIDRVLYELRTEQTHPKTY